MSHKEKYIADIFKSIGHPIRLKIIRLIYEPHTLSVTHLPQLLKIQANSQSQKRRKTR